MVDINDAARLLSEHAAQLLLAEEPGIQTFVCETVACCVNYWEATGVILDPITREAVLDSLVVVHIATAKSVSDLLRTAYQDTNATSDG